MTEQLSTAQPDQLKERGGEILDQCRLYSEFYRRHLERGVPVEYDGSKWKVLYWPERDGVDERLSITRGVTSEDQPVNYTIGLDGVVAKCDTLLDTLLPGDRLFFDTLHEQTVTDPGEIDMLMGVVTTAHTLSS